MSICRKCKDKGMLYEYQLCEHCFFEIFNECDDCGEIISIEDNICSRCSWENHKERIKKLG